MKKKWKNDSLFKGGRLIFCKILKLCAIFLLLFSLEVSAKIAVQDLRINVDYQNETLQNIIWDLQKKTDIIFLYKVTDISKEKKISVKVDNGTIIQILNKALKDTDLKYEISNDAVVIKKVQEKTPKKDKAKGVVTDVKGNPLPGVTIVLKGTKVGVSTDVNGKFTIVADKNDILIVSFIGMKTKEVKFLGKELKIKLEEETAQLEEIVCTGYKKTTVRRATGSVGVVKAKDLNNKATPVIDDILQGKIAGVSITKTSGRPGETAKIRIRGTNTLTGDAEPLWVVDGVPLQRSVPAITSNRVKSGDYSGLFTNGIAGINANDIENVTILKDASAAAIYGSRAAGGVIVITTKRGKRGNMSISYSCSSSLILKPQRDAGLMNSKEKLDWEKKLWDQFSVSGHQEYLDDIAGKSDDYIKSAIRPYPVLGLVGMVRAGIGQFSDMTTQEREAFINRKYNVNTDWFAELFQNSLTHNHHISLSGGNEKTTFYVSGGYSANEGLVQKTNYDRFNITSNITTKFNKKLSLNIGISGSHQIAKGYSSSVDPFKYAYFANPYERIYDENGNYDQDYTYFNFKPNNGKIIGALPANGYNIIREMNDTDSKSVNTSFSVNASVNWRIVKGLSFNGIASYSYTNNSSENFNGKYTYAAFQDRCYFDTNNNTRLYSSFLTSGGRNNSYTLRGQLSYNKYLGDNHRISVLLGSEVRESNAIANYSKRYGYDKKTELSAIPLPARPSASDLIDYNKLKEYANMVDGLYGAGTDQHRFASFYGSIDYEYKKKYITSFTLRADGSDCFGSKEQFNKNWSLGFAWHLDKEAFMSSLSPVISSLSLRAATGYTGNVNKTVSPYIVMTYESRFRNTENDAYLMGNIDNAPNENLRWEKTNDAKLALSVGLFENRINLHSEVYYRKSVDLVTNVQIPDVSGYSTQGFNTSEMENKGIEFSINAAIVKTKDFSWSTSMNYAKNINILTKYNVTGKYISGGLHVDYPVGGLFTGKLIGLNPATGYYNFVLRPDADLSSSDSKMKADNYLFYVGTKQPPISGGFSHSLRYKKISLSVYGNYCFGNKMFNDLVTPSSCGNINGQTNGNIQTHLNDVCHHHYNMNRDFRDVWSPENPNGKYPVLIDDCFGADNGERYRNVMDSRITKAALIEEMWYVRIKNISLSYTFDKKLIRKLNLASLSFSCGISNPFTFTDYSGIDPESSGAVYPITRTINFGLNVGF